MLCHAGGSALETVMYSLDRPAVLTLSLVLVAMISLPAQERPAPQKFATGTERPIVSFDAFAGADPSASAARGQATEPSDRPLPLPLPRASTVILVDDNQLSRQQAARLRPAFRGLIAKAAEPSGALMLVAPGSRISLLGQIPANTAALAAAADGIAGFRRDEQANFPIADAEALEIARGELSTLARVAARFVTLNPEMTADQATVFARELANTAAH